MIKCRFIWPDISFLPRPLRWFILLFFSAVFVIALEAVRIPAALMLGPMICAIILAVSGIDVKIPRPAFTIAQGVVGCMIARVITNDILKEVLTDWPLFIGGVVSVIIAATLIGYILAKKQVLPGTTAIWGSAPGGASAMVVMAEDYGADERLVAVMQYMRVVMVAAVGSILARFLSPSSHSAFAIDFFPHIDFFWFAITLLIAIGGSLGAKLSHIPAGGMLMPFLIAVVLQDTNLVTLVLPPWLLALSYMMIGWTIGLRFTRPILLYALGAIPILFLSILSLMALCGIFALVLSEYANVDLLTAYLATSPGGADSVAIIAASTAVNVPFVMAYQTVRFIIVTLSGPLIAKLVAKHLGLMPGKTPPKDASTK